MESELVPLVKLTIALALLCMMVGEGLAATARDFGYLRRNPAFALRALISVVVLVPLVAAATIWLIGPPLAVVHMLVVLAVAPAAPFALTGIGQARGRREVLVPFHLLVVLLAPMTVPVMLAVMGHIHGFAHVITPLAVFVQVGMVFLLPFGVGAAVRGWKPALAARIRIPILRVGVGLLVLALVAILAARWPTLLDLGPRSYLAMTVFVAGALVAGHAMGSPQRSEQIVVALESALRHPGLALFIGAGNFPSQDMLLVMIPYFVVLIAVTGAYKWLVRGGRMGPSTAL